MLLAICLAVLSEPTLDAVREAVATRRAAGLVKAVKTSYTQNAVWPKALGDVAPLLEEGKDGLLSPWGIPYQYVLDVNADGKVVPYVWTERAVGKVTKVYGTKLPSLTKKP